MRNLGLWFIIFSLPLIAVLGQDVYMAYNRPGGFDFTKPFPFSDTGWIWQHRAYGSWKWAHDAVPPALWEKFVKPVLNQRAVIVAAAPLVLLVVVLLFFKLIGVGPFAGHGVLVGRLGLRRRYAEGDIAGPKKQVRYKRR